jgi:NhaD family Na+/H+ antiporter
MEYHIAHLLIIAFFALGYLAIIFEAPLKVNKSASALLMAVATWGSFFLIRGHSLSVDLAVLGHHLDSVSQILFFLLGAMTLVELIDAHKGFKVITDFITASSNRKMLWIIGVVTFFLSSILDNLTTTIVMVSLIRKLVHGTEERLKLGALIVIAANAGGAWTPIGDVTTTMLWINGNISTLPTIRALFFPSLASLLVAIWWLGRSMHGALSVPREERVDERLEPGARPVFYAGLGALIFVPIFKGLTGLPPFMGILLGLGALWLLTDLLHYPHRDREHLRIPRILARVDTSSILFFLGILLCVGSLDAIGALTEMARFLDQTIGNLPIIATLIGLISAVVDNVPLVAAGMGMYDVASYPPDSLFWQLLAYCAGTGGSILIIGSAAGVAFMGMEKVDFFWYLRKASPAALVSYFAGIAVYLFIYLT